ncbi:MAG: arginase family protein [Candidatus Shapirobacteria bacterium]|nr:arginase family protein [Candidatus Shapirobacteria bacterium]MDD4410589.1 arginase family protein [Candidatus Shapirobacteria bacterium]
MSEKINPSFLNSNEWMSKNDSTRFSFIGIPIDKNCVSRPGTKFGPNAIRQSSLVYYYPEFEGLYDPEKKRYILTDKVIVDLGDIKNKGKNLNTKITESIRFIISNNSVPIVLGGDHSITYPILQAYNQKFNILHLDAHSDYQRFDESEAMESGLVMRRSKSLKNVNKIIHAGIRGYLNSGQGIRDSLSDGNSLITCEVLKKEGVTSILSQLDDLPLYISFDTDVLDPSICPGTTVPEPGGINYDLARSILTESVKHSRLIGADFVELNPKYDINQISSLHVSKLIIDMLGEI